MGVVVAATHLQLQQRVALKFLLPDMVHSPLILERFVREARAAAQLRGEHVCRVADVGTFEGGGPYIVMELLEGSDLASLLQAHGPMPVARAADHVLQACVGIAEAHALGIVHRDLKPANLFLTQRPDGTPLIKVLDFGIAKAQGDHNFSLTQTSAVLGSPGYMSPEQLRSTRDVDVRSDVWSIGVVLYELVAGRPPFVGETITELALRIAMDAPPPLVGRMPHGFDLVVNRCLSKDPAQRYPDLANLAHALAAYAGPGGWDLANAVSRLLRAVPGSGPSAAASGPVTQRLEEAATSVDRHPAAPTTIGGAASSMITVPSRRRRWALIAGVAVAAVAGAVVTAVALRGGRPAGAPAERPEAAASASAPAAVAPQPPTVAPSPPAVAPSPPPPAATPPPPAAAAAAAAAPAAAAAEPSAPVPEVRPAPRRPASDPAAGSGPPPRPPRAIRPPRPAKDPPRRKPERRPEDLGESRF